MTSATQRTLALLRKYGTTCQVVEKWNSFAKPFGRRVDLFGIIDIIAIRPGKIFGIQSTTGSGHSSHIHKILAEPRLKEWLEAEGYFELWSWAKRGPRGKPKKWTARVVKFKLVKGEVQYEE